MTRMIGRAGAAVLAALFCAAPALAESPQAIMQSYATAANSTPSAERGQAFFTTKQKEHSCSSCHGPVPVGMGKNVETGREIKPMAPAANPERFKDPARVERFFNRQCNFVYGRACTAGEKADVIAFLISLKP